MLARAWLLGRDTTGDLGTAGLLLSALSITVVVTALAEWALAIATTAVVELAATLTVVTVVTVAVVAVVVELALAAIVVLRVASLSPTSISHLLEAVGVVQVLHKVLLDFLEAALLTLLVQLVSGHPELDGEGASTEGCRLVELLDGTLGAVDVLVEDEILTVGRVGVKVFALAQFN